MTRWRTLTASMIVLALAASCWIAHAPFAEATGNVATSVPELDVVSVAPWVDPDGNWIVRFRMGEIPMDATLTYSVRQPLKGSDDSVRSQLRDLASGEENGSPLQGPRTVPIAALGIADGVASFSLAIRSSSGSSDRLFLPSAGVHPIDITVNSSDGTALAHQELFLNRLPSAAPRPPLLVALNVQSGFDPLLRPDGNFDIDDVTRRRVEALIARLNLLPAPASVSIPPQLVTALAASDAPADRSLLDRLRGAITRHVLIRQTWSRLHMESWATTGSLSDLQTQILEGQVILDDTLGVPLDTETWPEDPTVGPASIGALRQIGVRRVVVDAARLTPNRRIGTQSQTTGTFVLSGTDDATVDAMAVDPEITELLRLDGSVAVNLNLAITELLAPWFDADTLRRGSVVTVDDRTPSNVVAALSTLLADNSSANPPLRVAAFAEVFDTSDPLRNRSTRTTTVRTLSSARGTRDVGELSKSLATLRGRVGSYRSIFPGENRAATTVTALMASSLDRSLSASAQRRYVNAASDRIDRDLNRISVPKPRSLTVTARDATLPLSFTNDLDRDAHVRLHLRSPLLDFTDGQVQRLVLKAHSTLRVNVPVRVRASGQFLLSIELRSPDDRLAIASGRQTIRSTSFSGVGLILSGGALLVLVTWWIRTLRARNLEHAEQDDDHHDDEHLGIDNSAG